MECPDDAAIHSHVLPDVLARLDKTAQACRRRRQRGAPAGLPASQAALASTASPARRMATAREWSMSRWRCPRVGVSGGSGAALSRERPRRSPAVGLPMAARWRSPALLGRDRNSPLPPLPRAGRRPGSTWGVRPWLLPLPPGRPSAPPSSSRHAGATDGERGASRAATGDAQRWRSWRKPISPSAPTSAPTSARQRRDSPHREARQLVQADEVIKHEDVRVTNRGRNHHRAKSSFAAGWRALLRILTFQAESAGKRVAAVNPAFTSLTCSGCGVVVHKGLSVRWHSCPDGGVSLHRDHNAALTILWLRHAQSRRG
jgi:putative transposase